MRVGVIAKHLDPRAGGGTTFVQSVVDAIQSCKTEHTFLPYSPPADAQTPHTSRVVRKANSLVRKFQSRGKQDPSKKLSPFEEFVRDRQIELVWFLDPILRPAPLPYIATVWDLEHRVQPLFPEVSTTGWTWDSREQAYRSTLPRAARIFTGTEVGKSQIVSFYGVNPTNVVVNPMPIADAELKADVSVDLNVTKKRGLSRPFLFYPAQFWPHKNHVNLLLALEQVRRSGIPLDLVLTGQDKGNLAHVSEVISKLDLSSAVHILGFLSKPELRGLYKQALCLTFASLFGPDNIPPLEGFALGCPVLAARIPGAQEQLGDAALLFDPTDPGDIASAIATVYRDDQMRAQLITRGKHRVSSRTAQAYVAKACQVLDELTPFRQCWGHGYTHT